MYLSFSHHKGACLFHIRGTIPFVSYLRVAVHINIVLHQPLHCVFNILQMWVMHLQLSQQNQQMNKQINHQINLQINHQINHQINQQLNKQNPQQVIITLS